MSAVVYRAYNSDDRLLYVGRSVNFAARMRYHSEHSPWWPFHSYIVATPYATRSAAKAAERTAIETEHPRWNVQWRSADHPDGRIVQTYGRRTAPWLRDEIWAWQVWLRGERADRRSVVTEAAS